ncbi:MAG: hypothetical protein WC798_04055 [Candidatus Paceibacterota bacterium]|jgi:hypothetical protein
MQKFFPSFHRVKYVRRKIARDANLFLTARTIGVVTSKITGGKSVTTLPITEEKSPELNKNPLLIEGENVVLFEGKNPWDALRHARQLVGKIPVSLIMVRLYELARTYFIQNS